MNISSSIFYRTGQKTSDKFFSKYFFDFLPQKSQWDEKSVENMVIGRCNLEGKSTPDKFFYDDTSGDIIWGDISLLNKKELTIVLFNTDDKESDLEIALSAYKKWGQNCFKYLKGDFAFIIFDKQKNHLLCIRDPIGKKPFYYYIDNNIFLFSTDIRILSSFSFAREEDDLWIIDFLQNNRYYKDRTAFKHIKRLSPGNFMIVEENDISNTHYWNLEDVPELRIKSIEDAVDGLKYYLQAAVHVCKHSKIGIELSGGIDSSVITAIVANKVDRSNIYIFSNALPKQNKNDFKNFSDEWDKAALVAKKYNINNHFPIEDSVYPPIELLSKALDIIGYPTNCFMSLSQIGVYEKASTLGINHLFSGFGGDEMVSANLHGKYLYSLFKQKKIWEANNFIRKQGNSYFKSYAITAYYLYEYLLNKKKKKLNKNREHRWQKSIIKDEWLTKEQKEHFFNMLNSNPKITIRKKHFLELDKAGITDRLESGYAITSFYGLQYHYPLLDVALLEYFYSIPDKYKAHHKHGRALIRKAMEDSLPYSILNQSKGAGTATVPFYKIEMKQYFYILKNYCLSLHEKNNIFKYVDIQKVKKLEYDSNHFNFSYKHMMCCAMLSMHIDKITKKRYNEIE